MHYQMLKHIFCNVVLWLVLQNYTLNNFAHNIYISGELAFVHEGKYLTDEGDSIGVAVKTSKGNT